VSYLAKRAEQSSDCRHPQRRGWDERYGDLVAGGLKLPLSGCEHLLKHRQRVVERWRREAAKLTNQTRSVHCSDLIEHNMPDPSRKTARDTKWIFARTRGKRRDNECGQVLVEIVGRNDDAGTRFSHLAAARRIEVYQKDFTAAHLARCYHFHSSSSKRVPVGASSKRSSPRSRIRLAASAHPARGRAAGEMTMTPLRARISTSSDSPASAINGFGRRTPLELPMRTIRAFI